MINSGTPDGVPASFDCALRALAYDYGRALRPDRATAVAFHPDGAWLALGCADATIYLHDVSPSSASLGGEAISDANDDSGPSVTCP